MVKCICPRCGEKGALHAYYKYIKGKKIGPYFHVLHFRSKGKYRTHSLKFGQVTIVMNSLERSNIVGKAVVAWKEKLGASW